MKNCKSRGTRTPVYEYNTPMPPVKPARAEEKEKVFYLCDRRACEKCRPECSHTTDPSHAKSFVTTEKGGLWEVYPGLFDSTDLTVRQKLNIMANAEGEGAKK